MSSRASVLIRTRLQRPKPPPGCCVRTALLAQFDGILAHRLTRVVAPAGFGKSLALAAWADAIDGAHARIAWLRLEAGECDARTFAAYLQAALGTAGGRTGARAGRVLLDPPASATSAGDPRQVLSGLLAGLVERAERPPPVLPLVLVLDDAHWLCAGDAAELLARLLREAPDGFHLVLLARSLPVLAATELRARREILQVGPDALRVTAAEAPGFAQAVLAAVCPPDTLAYCCELSGGWPIALQLALRQLRAPFDARSTRARLPAMLAELETFLDADVLSALAPRVVEFLLLTSVSARLTPALADNLSGGEDAAEVLAGLVAGALATADHEADAGAWQVEPLIRRCLCERLERERPGHALLQHRRAGAWHAAQGDWRGAVEHALDGGEASQAAHWIEQGMEVLLNQGEFQVLLDWIARLPAEAIAGRPRLQLVQAWALAFLHHHEEAAQTLARLEAGLRAVERDVLAVRSVMTALADDSAQALLAGRRVLELVPAPGSLADHAAHTAVIFGLGAASRFEEVEALRAAQPAFSEPGTLASLYRQNLFGYSAFQAGRLDQAGLIFEDALARTTHLAGVDAQAVAVAASYLAAIHYERNDPERARSLLHERRSAVEAGASLGALLHCLRTLARLADLDGQAGTALRILEEGVALGRRRNQVRLQVGCLAEILRLQLAHGQSLAADRVLRTLLALGVKAPEDRATAASESWDMVRLAEARVLLASNAPRRAVPLLRSLWDDLTGARRAYLAAGVAVVLVRALEAAGDPEGALEPLWDVLSYGQQNGLLRTFADEGPALAGPIARLLLGRAPHPQLDPEYLRRLRLVLDPLFARQGSPAQGPQVAPVVGPALPRLSARETEILHYMARGHSNKEIARALGISPETVKWYLKHIYDKLQVSGRVQAIQAGLGVRMALVPEAEPD